MELLGARLVTGEHVVGNFDRSDASLVKAADVLEIRTAPPKEQGQPTRVFFTPLSPFAKGGKLEIVNLNVVAFYELDEEIAAGYRQVTSGLVTSASSIVAP